MMTNEYELPPNPITPMLAALIDKASGKGTADTVWQLMQEFAGQAIEADRKRRGEPVAWAMFADNGNIRIWARKPMSHPDCVPLYTAPQPAEPMKVPSDDQWQTLIGWLDRRRHYPTVQITGKVAGDIADLLARYGKGTP